METHGGLCSHLWQLGRLSLAGGFGSEVDGLIATLVIHLFLSVGNEENDTHAYSDHHAGSLFGSRDDRLVDTDEYVNPQCRRTSRNLDTNERGGLRRRHGAR